MKNAKKCPYGTLGCPLENPHAPCIKEEEKTKKQEKCAFCGEDMYTLVRAHHHTENGVDVTDSAGMKEWKEKAKGDTCPLCKGALDHNGYCSKDKWSVRSKQTKGKKQKGECGHAWYGNYPCPNCSKQ